jgi:predicted nuclease of restriction endonuclease-like (RecB) superfamily
VRRRNAIIPLDNPLKRDFCAEMCRVERWSVRTLRHKIDHLLFERTAVAKKPESLIEQDLTTLRDEDRLARFLSVFYSVSCTMRKSSKRNQCSASGGPL